MVITPRRTPWTTVEEYQMVFSCLFASDGDMNAQKYALDRIAIWMNRGGCPHAVESTSALLELVTKDSALSVGSSSSAASFFQPSNQQLRLGYSMALIRFVNSLVDPLQTTYFARSMSALAAQLGLPLWFVELRHAATHEDLPALSVLREAARQALDWLYTHYWLPSLASTTSAVPLLPIDPLRPLLAKYKSLTKQFLRDASQKTRLKPDLQKVYRSIDAWVIEAESLGRGRERAIEGLVEACAEVGGLVPTAKKKRSSLREPSLPAELESLWMPLIERLEDAYEGFTDALITRMTELLGAPVEPAKAGLNPGVIDRTYPLTLQAWIIHLINQLSSVDSQQMTEQIVKSCLLSSTPDSLSLVDALAKTNPSLSKSVAPLINVMRNADSGLAPVFTMHDGDNDDSAEHEQDIDRSSKLVDEMEQRMRELDQRLKAAAAAKSSLASSSRRDDKMDTGSISGVEAEVKTGSWQLASNWKPCPIGALPGGKIPNLDLPSPALASVVN